MNTKTVGSFIFSPEEGKINSSESMIPICLARYFSELPTWQLQIVLLTVKNILHFAEQESSLPYSQKSALSYIMATPVHLLSYSLFTGHANIRYWASESWDIPSVLMYRTGFWAARLWRFRVGMPGSRHVGFVMDEAVHFRFRCQALHRLFHIHHLPGLVQTNKQTPWPLVRERNIPTKRSPLVDEI
jgi:hypothetical protein